MSEPPPRTPAIRVAVIPPPSGDVSQRPLDFKIRLPWAARAEKEGAEKEGAVEGGRAGGVPDRESKRALPRTGRPRARFRRALQRKRGASSGHNRSVSDPNGFLALPVNNPGESQRWCVCVCVCVCVFIFAQFRALVCFQCTVWKNLCAHEPHLILRAPCRPSPSFREGQQLPVAI